MAHYPKLKSLTGSYDTLTALITQTSSNTPLVYMLENTSLLSINPSRQNNGEYFLSISGSLPNEDKVALFHGSYNGQSSGLSFISMFYKLGDGGIIIKTWDSMGILSDGILNNTSLEIRVYK